MNDLEYTYIRMNITDLLNRIIIDPKVMVGKPVIKGTRLTVQYILKLLSNGESIDEILDEYDGLTKKDILACLLFATEALEQSSFYPLQTKAI